MRWLTKLLGILTVAAVLVPSTWATVGSCVVRQVISPRQPLSDGQPAPNIQVRVCPSTATGTPCSPLAPSGLFTDPALTHPLPNPLSTDDNGIYFWCAAQDTYLVQETPLAGTVYSYLVTTPSISTGDAISLQGVPINPAAPTTNDVLQFNGTWWTPTTLALTTNNIQGTPIDPTPPVPPSVFVANTVAGSALAQWANGTVGQGLSFAFTSTPPPPITTPYNDRSGWTVAVSSEQTCPNHFCPGAASSGYYLGAHMIEEPPAATPGNWITEWDCSLTPGPGDPMTLCPNRLPATVTVNMGSVQPVGTVGYLAGINNTPNTSAVAGYFDISSDAACVSGWTTVIPATTWTPTTGIVTFPLASVTSGRCVRMTITAMSSVPAGALSCNTSSTSCSASGSGIFVWPTIQASTVPPAVAVVHDKLEIDALDIGVDCTGTVDSSWAINSRLASGSHMNFGGASHCPLVRVDSPIKPWNYYDLDLDGGGHSGPLGTKIFGCNGTAGDPVFEGNGYGHSGIRGFNIIANGAAAGLCNGDPSNFSAGILLRRTTGFAQTPTNVAIEENYITPDNGAANPSTVSGFIGIGWPDQDNNENMWLYRNNINCGHAADSVGINILDTNSDNGMAIHNNVQGCRYGTVNWSHWTFIGNQGSDNGNYQYFGSGNTGCTYALAGSALTRIESQVNSESSGGFICVAPASSGSIGTVTLKDNEMGPDVGSPAHIGPTTPLIDVGTGGGVYFVGYNHAGAHPNGLYVIGSTTTLSGGNVVSQQPAGTWPTPGLLDPASTLNYYGPEGLSVDKVFTGPHGGGTNPSPFNSPAVIAESTYASSTAVLFDNFAVGRNVLAKDITNSVLGSSLQFYHRVNQNADAGITSQVEVHDAKLAGGLVTIAASAVPTPTLATVGTAGSTTYGYKIVGISSGGLTYTSAEATIATGNATLTSSNYITQVFILPLGYHTFQLWRTTGGTAGMIASFQPGESANLDCGTLGPPHTNGCLGGEADYQKMHFYDDGQAPITGGSPSSTNTADGRITSPAIVSGAQLQSTITTGTPPLVIASTTNVANLNASSLSGATFASPGAIGIGTPSTGAFTALSASGQITSTVTTGTAPIVVASTTTVTNLSAATLNGATFAAPGAIGGGTPNTGAFTTLSATGQVTSTLSSGTAPLVVASTTPVANLTAVPVTYDHSGTQQTAAHLVQDSCTLGTDCSVTLTGAAIYTSSTSYTCVCEDDTAVAACKVVQSSGSAFAITGTGTDSIRYVCIGN